MKRIIHSNIGSSTHFEPIKWVKRKVEGPLQVVCAVVTLRWQLYSARFQGPLPYLAGGILHFRYLLRQEEREGA